MGGQAAAFVAAVKDFHHRVHRAHRGALYSPLFSVSSAPSVVNLALKLRLARAAAKIPNSSRNGPSIRSGRKRSISLVRISTDTGLGSAEGRLRVAKYDVAIIGSGPGGYVAAIRAGELGLKTVVVEKDPFLGGTCLHVGCIPTKVLLHHAEVYDHFKNGAELGFEVSGLKINWGNVLARKDKIVKKHAKGIEFLFKKNKVEWVQGWGRYEGPGRVSVEKDGRKTQTLQAEKLLLAVGRKPMTDNCGLEKSKAKVERGAVHVGPYMETAEKGLYAIGDIVFGLPLLAHAAMMEGIAAVTHIAGKPAPAIVKERIPNATYCEPQIGSIGLTEKQAREAGYAVKTSKFPLLRNSKATILGNHRGFIKVVSDEKYGEVLGVHIIGPLATEILAEAAAGLHL